MTELLTTFIVMRGLGPRQEQDTEAKQNYFFISHQCVHVVMGDIYHGPAVLRT